MIRTPSLAVCVLSALVILPAAHADIDPGSLRLDLDSEAVTLSWTGEGTYALHRGATPQDLSDPANRFAMPNGTSYEDPMSEIDCDPCFYRVEVIDDGFDCGHLLCEIDDEYCFTIFPGVPEIPIDFSCLFIPAQCLPVEICPCLESVVNEEWGGAAECVEHSSGGHSVIVALP
jgi:hypothetical protein